jgi:hypothetical protein
VYIRNELRRTKMDDEFNSSGEVIENEYGDVYKVITENGAEIGRHTSQLKKY